MNKVLRNILMVLVIILLLVLAIITLTNCTAKKIEVVNKLDSVEVDNTNKHITIIINSEEDLILDELIKESNKGTFKLYLNDNEITDNKINIKDYNFETDIYITKVTSGNKVVEYKITLDLSNKISLIDGDIKLDILYRNAEGKLDSETLIELLGYLPVLFYDSELTEEVNLDELSKGDINKGLNLYYSSLPVVVKHTIKFESNGGQDIPNQDVIDGQLVTLPNEPTREHYTFKGWFSNIELTTEFDFDTNVTNEFTLYAKWEINEYTVTFNSNGGIPIADKKVDANGVIDELPQPTKEQHRFMGWYIDEDLEVKYIDGSNIVSNITLYAKWELIEYTVSFDSNGGSEVADQVITQNELANEPDVPTKEHYIFKGWYTEDTLENKFEFATTINEDIILYAKWEAVKYKVTFETNDVNTIEPLEFEYNNKIELPNEPIRLHYNFIGWFTDQELNNEFDLETKISRDITLYAKWEIIEYTVSFETNGGSSVADQVITEGDFAEEPEVPTKEHYTFKGWYTENTLENKFEFATSINEDITLYAKWEAVEYTVTFETNEGNTIEPIKVEYNNKLEMPNDPTKTTYNFIGWFTDQALNNIFNEETLITENITLYAKWEIIEYTVSFETKGGSAVEDQVIIEGDLADKPETQTKLHHTFKGWYKEDTLENEFDFNSTITENITLYAKWEIIEYTVSFETNGGSSVEDQVIIEGDFAEEPEVPTNQHYIFKGWYTEDTLENKFEFRTTINEDIILYAKWKAVKYTVTFETNDGNTIEPLEFEYNNKIELPNDPIRIHYNFIGWFTDQELNNEFEIETKITENITLYAKWEIIEYTVTFDTNEGSSIDPIKVEYNNTVEMPNDPNKDTYEFIGWFTDQDLINEFDLGTKISGDITLYAKWEIIEYTVSFNSKGGNLVDKQTIIENQVATKPEEPTKVHYTFKGWYTEETLVNEFDFKTTINEDITLYAKWEAVEYTVTFETNKGSHIDPVAVVYKNTFDMPEDPIKAHYKFIGWYLEQELINEFAIETIITGNITLYAKWEVEEYTVTFETNEGSTIEPIKVEYNKTFNMPDDPTKVTYEFIGWFTDQDLINEFDLGTKISGDITLYAKWEIIEYTVSFNSKGGSLVDKQTIIENQVATKPEEPTKVHYTFKGWYTEETLVNEFDFKTTINENITLYAKWEAVEYTVTFETNEGSHIDPIAVVYKNTFDMPEDPIKAHYKFIGWYLEQELINEFAIETIITGNITLYAKWEVLEYTVTFDTNEGSTIEPIKVEYNNTFNMPDDPTKVTYEFIGWFTDQSLNNYFNPGTLITKNITLYAKWEIIEYTVTFYSNSGSNVLEQVIVENNFATEPEAPTNQHYNFVGWYSDSTLNNKFDFNTPIKSDITLYGKWEAVEYTVTFETNEGSIINPIKVEYNKTFDMPNDPTKDNHKFISWYLENTFQNEYDFNDKVTSDITIYARLEEYKYTIEFVLNGGQVDGDTGNKEFKFTEYDYSILLSINNLFSTPVLVNTEVAKFNKFTGWGYEGKVYTNLEIGNKPLEYGKTIVYANYEGLYNYQLSTSQNEYSVLGYKKTVDAKNSGLLVFDSSYYNGYPVTKIANSAFKDNGSNLITQFVIGDNIKEIGSSAFENMNFSNGQVFIPSNVIEILDNAFLNATFNELEIASGDVGRKIYPRAFSGNASLVNIDIGTGFINIGKGVFLGNTRLVDLILPHLGYEPITSEDDLITGTLGFLFMDDILGSEIPKDAAIPVSLRTIHIRNNDQETNIGHSAFSELVLEEMTVIIGAGVKTLYGNSFKRSKFKEIKLDNAVDLNDIKSDAFLYTQTEGTITIPKNVIQIRAQAFFGSKFKILNFTEDTKIRFIGTKAFWGMGNLDIANLYGPIGDQISDEDPNQIKKQVESSLFMGAQNVTVYVHFKKSELPDYWEPTWPSLAPVIYLPE